MLAPVSEFVKHFLEITCEYPVIPRTGYGLATNADGVHALQENLMTLIAEVGGLDTMRTWSERVEKEWAGVRESVEQHTAAVREIHERIEKYYTTALKDFYERRDDAYCKLQPDVLVKEVVELLREDSQAELEFRKQLIDKIAEKISARFHGVVPIRTATRDELKATEPVIVTRPATHAEALASISQEHQRNAGSNEQRAPGIDEL